MENDYQTELDERIKQKQFERQQAIERAGMISQLTDKVKQKAKRTNNHKLRGAKKKAKIWLAIGRIVLSWGLSPAAWAALFKENLTLGVLCLSAYILIISVLLALLVLVIMMSICQATGSFIQWLVGLVSDKLDFCKAF